MAKSLLILALSVAQVGASGGSPLYLCRSEDGSVCIDGGPAACICCHADEPAEDSCRHRALHRDDGTDTSSWRSADDECGCTHVQISQAQLPAVPGSFSVKSEAVLDIFAALAPEIIGPRLLLQQVSNWRPGGLPPPSASSALGALASVVLQC